MRSYNTFYVRQSAIENVRIIIIYSPDLSDFYHNYSLYIQPGFPVTFRTPTGCNREECDMFVGINSITRNSSAYLDIYMEGTADGWLAVGFTKSRDMVRIHVP